MRNTDKAYPAFLVGCALTLVSGASGADDAPQRPLKHESFDKDPGWEARNNRLRPKVVPTITQDFGYRPAADFAGKTQGAVGGRVVRCATPTYYAADIGRKTLNDRLSASGTFVLRASAGSSGVFFGWFNADQRPGGGRPVQSLGLDLDGEPSGARLAVRMINRTNQSCGTFITPFIPGKFRPTPIRHDGTLYSWTIDYDPNAHDGGGQFRITFQGHGKAPEPLAAERLPDDLPAAHRKEALSHFPNQTTFTVDLPPGFKATGATFDRFGLLNLMKPGNALSIDFTDLRHDGAAVDLTRDPGWAGSQNHATLPAMPAGAHDYGYSPDTSFAGGRLGELGGDLWRSGPYGYYADRVGPLTLDDRLEARGKVVLQVGAPDSDVFLGWFQGGDSSEPPSTAGNFVGVHIGGPTRVGHYFQPVLTTSRGTRAHTDAGPVLRPGKPLSWSIVYDPAANNGQGAVRATLGEETVTLALKKGWKAEGAKLDRFGLFTPSMGGQLVRIFLDDLNYTAARAPR